MANNPSNLRYTKTHEWVSINGDIVTIGITDFAQSELGDLVFAEAVPTGRAVEPGKVVGSVESVKTASDLYSPVTGTIIASNEELGGQSEKVNQDPYGSWFVRVRIEKQEELDRLLDAAAYEAFCQEG
jgi:glycine cleavage system H protein